MAYAAPDADTATTGWSDAPLWSKVDDDPDSPDGVVITAGGQDTYADVMAATSPSAWWRMGEASGDLADSSSNSHTLTAANVTYGQTGWAGDGTDAVQADGSTSYLRHADDADWDMGTGDFTVQFALKLASWPTVEDKYVIGHNGAGATGEWEIYLESTQTGAFKASVDAGNDYHLVADTTSVPADGDWHMYHFVWDRSASLTLYIDGTAQTDTEDISGTSSNDLTNTEWLYLVSRAPTSRNLACDIGEVAIWKGTALSSATISDIVDAQPY